MAAMWALLPVLCAQHSWHPQAALCPPACLPAFLPTPSLERRLRQQQGRSNLARRSACDWCMTVAAGSHA
jgi:hypothetical protein